MHPPNNAKRWVVVSVVLFFLGNAMILTGILKDDYDFYWMIFVGLILTLTFLICFFMFVGQARHLDRMFRGKERYAYWKFPENQQQKKIQNELTERKARHKMLLIIITAFFVLIGGVFLIFGFDDFDEARLFVIIMGSVLAVIYAFALITPYVSHRKMLRSLPEVYVGPYGAWVMGQYTQWKTLMTRITHIHVRESKTGTVLDVWFMIWQRYGPQPHVCRIPVPDGMEAQAKQVAQDIASFHQVPLSMPADEDQ
jgi:hypothetical protein